MSQGSPADPRVATDPETPPPPPVAIESRPFEVAMGHDERRLRAALEAGEVAIWEWEIGSGEVRWSENLEQVHGLARGDLAPAFDAHQAMIHPDDRERVAAAIRACLEGRAGAEIEFRGATPDDARWVLVRGRIVPGAAGGPPRMVGVSIDITERKRTEAAVREANRRKDDFLAMVSHELRNPLGAILNASTLVAQLTRNDPEAAQACAAIRRQTDRLVRVVDDLMDVSRLSAGKLTLRRTNVDLVALVHRSIHDLAERRLLDRHRHELRLAATRVSGDGPRLEQIVSNLLMNAIRYTPPGGTIGIALEPEGGEAVLRVRDTGVGIAPELLPRIFDLFVQSDRGLERRDGGLGVGLSIARDLVEAHGGRIEAHSAGPDRGTEFVVRLPLAAALAPGEESDGSPRRRILVVDDNVDARGALARLLEMAGHEVVQAGDGPAALESVSRARPEAAIVDIGLPGMNGFELARRLKAAAPRLRLIALSGYGQDDHRRLGEEVGFETFLIKPASFEALRRALADG